MKKVFLFFAMIVSMAAASAATLTHNFTDDTGKNFSIKNAYQVEKTAGYVLVTSSNGSTYTYVDASGALYTKLVNYMATTGGSYFQLAGTLTHMNVAQALQITCYGAGNSQTAFSYGNYTKFVTDSCAARATIASQSN